MPARFAPSPTGLLHLGHAYAAARAWAAAQATDGIMLLRLEDIDSTRCRPEYEAAIFEDLKWLGLSWPEPVWRQSERMVHYREALRRLEAMDLLYPCFCTRRDLAAIDAPQGPDGPLYPGTCRHLSPLERASRLETAGHYSLRLDVAAALQITGPLTWRDLDRGLQPAKPELLGDVILARKDIATSYHLAVTIDDAAQEVTIVTRGEDLFASTHIHRLLQALLALPEPVWQHHRLVLDDKGRRLAKRADSLSIRSYRQNGCSAEAVFALAGA